MAETNRQRNKDKWRRRDGERWSDGEMEKWRQKHGETEKERQRDETVAINTYRSALAVLFESFKLF